ncbi:MAG: hypothetical protein HZB33_05855 [Nitrospirae bacterium]|nr:hypothetical protein [Nitrospirota bacterium]
MIQLQLKRLKINRLPLLLYGVLICASTVFLLKPISDNDFFWHLKTGQWIWEHGGLPDHDVFSYTVPADLTESARFILTSYWLSQVSLYAVFLLGEMTGIVFLRFILMAALLFVMFRRWKGDETLRAALLALFSVAILKFYFFERPQVLSLLFFAMLLCLLEKIKTAALPGPGKIPATFQYRPAVSTALLMLVWANSHGGHSLGQVTLLLFIVMEAVKFLHPSLRPMDKMGYASLLAAGAAGLACSFINPNTYNALGFSLITNVGAAYNPIQEYSSLPEFFSMSGAGVVLLYYFLMALAVVLFAASPKKTDIAEAALLAGIGYYSFMHARFAGFFPIAVLPFFGRRLSGDRIIRWSKVLLVPLAVFAAVFFAHEEWSLALSTAKEGRWISSRRFPVEAADFILANSLPGNMYNSYDWGGYLIWRLAPERKVFIDGRNLDASVSLQAELIGMADASLVSGQRMWMKLLQRYGVTYIITASHSPSGEVMPLAKALSEERQWVQVFSHRPSRSVIFVKDVRENAQVINKYAMPRQTIN